VKMVLLLFQPLEAALSTLMLYRKYFHCIVNQKLYIVKNSKRRSNVLFKKYSNFSFVEEPFCISHKSLPRKSSINDDISVVIKYLHIGSYGNDYVI
jgi:hypothetical protein